MKSIYFLWLIGLLTAGCVRYQYAVVDSNLDKSKKGEIVFENDSLKLTYQFKGINGPASIHLFNKLDVPLFVNWQRSSVIIGDKSFSRAKESSDISASAIGTQINWTETLSTTHNSIDGSIKHSPQIGFIPPKSFIESNPIDLSSAFFNLSGSQMQAKNSYGTRVRYQDFDENSTPMSFRSYLTLSLTPDFQNPIVIDQQFWVSEVAVTLVRPANLEGYAGREDVFHLSEINGFGVFAGFLGVLVPVLFLTAAE
jgi:hypothetical protein